MDAEQVLKVPIKHPKTLYRNYATSRKLAAKAKELVLPMLKRTRRNRQSYDRKAMRRYNQWALVVDDRYYIGRANMYIPAVRRGVERLVAQWIRETFPTDEWWGCEATDKEFEGNVAGQKALMDVQLKRRMRLKRKARPAYRQLALYGTSPLKVPWRYQTRTEPSVTFDPELGRAVVEKKTTVLYDDPDFLPVDYFAFGVYPLTVMDVDDAKLVYEDIVCAIDELEHDPDNYANVQQAKENAGSGTSGSEALIYRRQRLQQLGITEDETNDKNFVFLTECYVDFDFEDKFGLGPEPAIVTLAWESVVVRLQRNPYRRPPYFVMKDAEMIAEFLAHARTESTDRLQIGLNDASNQQFDAASFANNPMVVIDPNAVEDYNAISIYPGAKIPSAPDAVKFDRPPDAAYSQKETVAYLYNVILENLGTPAGASPSPASTGMPRGARTFGGMQMLQALAGSESKELVEFQEDAVWEPILAWIAWLNANFMGDGRILKTAGRKGAAVTVNRDTFAGDYAYEWLGTSTVQNQMVRGAQMLVGMNILGRFAMIPGMRPNMPYIFGEWWKSQGLKGSDRLFLDEGRQEPIEPDIENELVRLGRAIEVSPRDNDGHHIASHSRARMQYPPESNEHGQLLLHEQAHFHQFVMKQRAMEMTAAPAVNGTGPAPNGSRAGRKPTMTPQSGFGPARAMMDAPGGVPAGAM